MLGRSWRVLWHLVRFAVDDERETPGAAGEAPR